MYFDTHAHYDDEAFQEDRDALVSGLPARGISLVLNPGSDVSSSRQAVALADRYSFLYAAVGVHPHEAGQMEASDLERLQELSCHSKVMAIGEIGLDYFYNYSPREIQKECFRRQMALAEQNKLPAIIHDREAHADCLEIIRSFPNVRGVLHCYSGSFEMAKTLLDLGWFLSFNGAITFKNARRAPEVIRYMPADRLMLETDAPYLTPTPYRGKRNDSGYLPLVAQAIAQIRGIPAEEVAAFTAENGKRLFGIPSQAGTRSSGLF